MTHNNIYEISKYVSEKKGELNKVKSNLRLKRKERTELNKSITHSNKARDLILKVSQETQRIVEIKITNLITTAIQEIISPEYECRVDFDLKNNQLIADVWVVKNEKESEPMFGHGGGVVDIFSMSSRLSLWSLSPEGMRTRPILILDEPFKFVSEAFHNNVSTVLNKVKNKLGIQIIMTTHIKEPFFANKSFLINDGKIIKEY